MPNHLAPREPSSKTQRRPGVMVPRSGIRAPGCPAAQVLAALVLLAGCAPEPPATSPTAGVPRVSAAGTDAPAALGGPGTLAADAAALDWINLAPGLAHRVVQLATAKGQRPLLVVRLNPEQYEFRVAYRPGAPLNLADWHSHTGASVVANGGFFDEANRATALTIAGGHLWGRSYTGFGGMFTVTPDGPKLRWLVEEPYRQKEELEAALQSFPMLVAPGGRLAYDSAGGQRSRRTLVARARDGRILLAATTGGGVTLSELAQGLVESDLDVDAALNLDGGASSGLLVIRPGREGHPAEGESAAGVPAAVPVPMVLLAQERR